MDTFREVEDFFKRLPGRLEKAIHEALQHAANEVEKDISTILKTEGRSHNVEWSPLKEAYVKWKTRKGFSEKKLHKTTSMKQSLGQKWERNSVIVGVNARDSKTGFPYPIAMEYGTQKGIPPRPFMTPVFQKLIKDKVLEKALKKALRKIK